MKVVCHELAQATSDPEGSAMDELVKDADRLVSCLANKAITNLDFIIIINATFLPFLLPSAFSTFFTNIDIKYVLLNTCINDNLQVFPAFSFSFLASIGSQDF